MNIYTACLVCMSQPGLLWVPYLPEHPVTVVRSRSSMPEYSTSKQEIASGGVFQLVCAMTSTFRARGQGQWKHGQLLYTTDLAWPAKSFGQGWLKTLVIFMWVNLDSSGARRQSCWSYHTKWRPLKRVIFHAFPAFGASQYTMLIQSRIIGCTRSTDAISYGVFIVSCLHLAWWSPLCCMTFDLEMRRGQRVASSGGVAPFVFPAHSSWSGIQRWPHRPLNISTGTVWGPTTGRGPLLNQCSPILKTSDDPAKPSPHSEHWQRYLY